MMDAPRLLERGGKSGCLPLRFCVGRRDRHAREVFEFASVVSTDARTDCIGSMVAVWRVRPPIIKAEGRPSAGVARASGVGGRRLSNVSLSGQG